MHAPPHTLLRTLLTAPPPYCHTMPYCLLYRRTALVPQVWLGATPYVVVSDVDAARRLMSRLLVRPNIAKWSLLVGEAADVNDAGLLNIQYVHTFYGHQCSVWRQNQAFVCFRLVLRCVQLGFVCSRSFRVIFRVARQMYLQPVITCTDVCMYYIRHAVLFL